MLTANVGVSVATHFCGGEYVATKVAVGEAKADCGMAGSESQDTSEGDQQSYKSLCCVNHVTTMSLATDFEQLETVGQLSENMLILGWFSNITNAPFDINIEFTHFIHLYSPPQTIIDIPILIQSFLI